MRVLTFGARCDRLTPSLHLPLCVPFAALILLWPRACRKLAPEGVVRELDVPASRCIPVKASLVARTSDADKEVWDILDSEPYATADLPAPVGSAEGKAKVKAKKRSGAKK